MQEDVKIHNMKYYAQKFKSVIISFQMVFTFIIAFYLPGDLYDLAGLTPPFPHEEREAWVVGVARPRLLTKSEPEHDRALDSFP